MPNPATSGRNKQVLFTQLLTKSIKNKANYKFIFSNQDLLTSTTVSEIYNSLIYLYC